jgi:hypothetical protein
MSRNTKVKKDGGKGQTGEKKTCSNTCVFALTTMGKSNIRVTKLIADYGPWSVSKILHRDHKNTTRVLKTRLQKGKKPWGAGEARETLNPKTHQLVFYVYKE